MNTTGVLEGMTLDVDTPEPPALDGPGSREAYTGIEADEDDEPTDDGRRAALAAMLHEGAWADAFAEWTEHTYLTEEEFAAAAEHGLFEALDFYWDRAAGEVGYRVPALGDAREAFEDPQGVEEELEALARAVADTLETEYLPREDEEFGFFEGTDTDLERGDE